LETPLLASRPKENNYDCWKNLNGQCKHEHANSWRQTISYAWKRLSDSGKSPSFGLGRRDSQPCSISRQCRDVLIIWSHVAKGGLRDAATPS